MAILNMVALPRYNVAVAPLLPSLVSIAQSLASPFDIPMLLDPSLPLARPPVSLLHRPPMALELDYRVMTMAMLPVDPFAEHASAHLLSGDVDP